MAMACSWFRLHSLYFLISYLLTHSLTHPYDHPDGYSPTAMILPLLLSPSNSSRPSIDINRRRHLQKHANAHMRLHDDLLTHGYYTTRLWIGTPPQEFALIVDSGSTVTYVPCSTCQQCGKHLDPRFQPDLSRTYRPLKCSLDCICEGDDGQCTYERQYAEMSSSSGVLGEDIISFGKESALEPQRAVFGCENSETGDLFTQHADGIIGLGRGRLSIMDQLVDNGAISDSFSLCYGGMGIGGGAMVLGRISPPPDMVFSHSDPFRSPYYNIELKEIHVAGKLLQLKPGIFNGKHGTVLDSGTTYAYLPEAAFVAFRDAVLKTLHPLKRIHGPDPTYNDICFSGAGSDVSELSKSFPKVDMVFDKGGKLSLAPENYMFRHSKVHGAYCLGIFQNGKDPTTLLGASRSRHCGPSRRRKLRRKWAHPWVFKRPLKTGLKTHVHVCPTREGHIPRRCAHGKKRRQGAKKRVLCNIAREIQSCPLRSTKVRYRKAISRAQEPSSRMRENGLSCIDKSNFDSKSSIFMSPIRLGIFSYVTCFMFNFLIH